MLRMKIRGIGTPGLLIYMMRFSTCEVCQYDGMLPSS